MATELRERKKVRPNISFVVNEALREEFEDYVNEYDSNITDVCRTALVEYLEKRRKLPKGKSDK
ncbi:MAG: hypothetical protein H7A25_18385 [Leptospiraceae bacterium]|nr:hypothetical protein [Leptospiraceae bacterium]